MFRYRSEFRGSLILLMTAFLFLLTSCSNLPLIGKKEDKDKKTPAGKTVTVEGMEQVKGVNPPKQEEPPSKKPATSPPPPKREAESKVASVPTRPFYSSPLPFFQAGFRRKVVTLDFENKTTYEQEKIGEAAAKRLNDRLEATQRVVTMDKAVVSEALKKQEVTFRNLTDPSAMKQANQTLGIQAFALGTVAEVSLLSSKASDTSDEEVSFATAKVEVRLIDASTGNLLRTFIGRSPIFGTKEAGQNSRGKAVLKAIDLSLDEIADPLLRQLDLLDWTTTIARIDGDSLYINAGKQSGLRIGDTLEVYQPGKEIIHPSTNLSLGWTTGQLKGLIRITDLFGVDAAAGRVVEGKGFAIDDVVKSTAK